MARQPRLRLAQDFREVGNREFGLGDEREDAQPRRFAGGLEGRGEGREGELGSVHAIAELRNAQTKDSEAT